MKKNPFFLLTVLLIVSMTNMQCSSSSKLLSSGSSLMSLLGKQPDLSSLTGLLQTPGLSNLLGGSLQKPFTLLAPTNDALNAVDGGSIANLTKPENLSSLAGLLKNHIIPGKKDAATISGGGISTAAGNALNLGQTKLGTMLSTDQFNIIPIDKVLQ